MIANLEALHQQVTQGLDTVLTALGENRSSSNSVAYDTAWALRLLPHFPDHGFDVTRQWLYDHQHQDGSWGSSILHYHDRLVSTMAALIALKPLEGDDAHDARLRAGERFLWREYGRLSRDAHDTIGFPVLSVALVRQAQAVGLDVPETVYQDVTKVEKKFNLLGHNPASWRHTSLIFSFEALSNHIADDVVIDFSEDNGSVAASPSATVAAILSGKADEKRSLDYISTILNEQGDGGMAFVKPFDIFESAWTLHYLSKTGLIQPDDPRLKPILDFLWSRWSPEKGVSFSSYFPVPDLDDTAVTYALLRWAGYPISADVFRDYEEDTHFRCYPGEIDLSISANIRTLVALQQDHDHPLYARWHEKIVALLRRYDVSGSYWFDKWHMSPYYLTGTSVWSLLGVVDDVLPERVRWITKTQREDGGWGYYDGSTPEETAYCLEALLLWDREVAAVDADMLHAAAAYIMDHYDPDNHVSLWLAKSVYTPRTLVRAVLVSALNSYQRYLERTG